MSERTRREQLTEFLEGNLGVMCLAPMTGTDWRALVAATEVIEVFSYSGGNDLLKAFEILVMAMQPKCREFAYHAIAMVMNWETRRIIWRQTRLCGIAPQLCAYEPGGSAREAAVAG